MRFIILAFILCSSFLFARPTPKVIYLTWQHDPTTTMTIQWMTPNSDLNSTLYYQDKDAKKNQWTYAKGNYRLLPEKVPYVVHRVEVQGLRPDTLYRFHFGDATKPLAFRTMPANLQKPVRFIVGGDAHQSSLKKFRAMNKAAAKVNPRFAVIGGDIAYSAPKGSKKNAKENFGKWRSFFECWTEEMRDKDGCLIPMFAAIGNHEVKGSFQQTKADAPFFYAFFGRGYHDFGFGNYLHLTFLNSGHTHPVQGLQTKWLDQVLKTHAYFLHRFATYHVGAYPSTGKFDDRVRRRIRENWVPLFEKYRIDACFENHDHAYKRTFPLINGKNHPEGVLYFGDGSWGTSPRKPKKQPYLAFAAAKQQVLVVDISQTDRKFWAIDPKGKVIDRYEQKTRSTQKISKMR